MRWCSRSLMFLMVVTVFNVIVCEAQQPRSIPYPNPFQHVVVMGEGGAAALSQGQVVGFDVGWTSHGLVVTRIQPVSEAPGPRSER